ncbi:MAG: choice-of-anchor D domain-containing protein, partial [bacterium]
GAPIAFLVVNEGTAPLQVFGAELVGPDAAEFLLGSGAVPFTLDPGRTRQLFVSFAPSGLGPRSALLRLRSDAPDRSTLDVALEGNGFHATAPDIAVTPASHAWGEVMLGDGAVRIVQIRNEGDADLQVASTQIGGADSTSFAIESGGAPFALAPGESASVAIRFAPVAVGPAAAALRVTSNDPDEGSLDVALAGIGVAPPAPDIAATPPSVDWGDVMLGQSALHTVLFRNEGDVDLQVSSTALEGSDAASFAIESGGAPFALAPGESASVAIRFGPAALGPAAALLRVGSNDPDESSLDVVLAGSGIPVPAPDVAVTPASRDWGVVTLGESAVRTVEIRNEGELALEVLTTELAGAGSTSFFLESGRAPVTLPPGASASVAIRFSPAATGPVAAVLRIESNDPDEGTIDVALAGRATAPPPPDAVAFAAASLGGSVALVTVASEPLPASSADDLYLAAVSSKGHVPVAAIDGLGLSWTLVRAQCGARTQTGLSVFRALGPTAGGVVTAT